jgi:hypothetical protein
MARYPSPDTISPLAHDLFVSWLTRNLEGPAPPSSRVAPSTKMRKGEWTRARCLTALRTFITTHERAPTRTEWHHASANGLFSWHTMRRFWPSVAACLMEARQQGDGHVD